MPRLRVHFSKRGKSVFVPHVDLPILFARAARRAGLAMEMTSGFSPHPKTALGPPLPVGVVGLNEPAEFWFLEWSDSSLGEFRSFMPEGIDILDARECGGVSLNKLCSAASYIIEPRNGTSPDRIAGGLEYELKALESLLDIRMDGREVFLSVCDLERSGPSRMVKALVSASLAAGWKDLSIVRSAVGRWDSDEMRVVPLTEEFYRE